MRASRLFPAIESQEPVGLVIADGGLGDHVPRFSAFVWGPVPDDEGLLADHGAATPRARESQVVAADAVIPEAVVVC